MKSAPLTKVTRHPALRIRQAVRGGPEPCATADMQITMSPFSLDYNTRQTSGTLIEID